MSIAPLEENKWPDGWMAANWEPPRMLREFRMPPRRKQRRNNSSSDENDVEAVLAMEDHREDGEQIMDEPEPEVTE